MTETWTILKMLEWMTGYFTEKGIDSSRREAELLLSFALPLTRVQLYTQFDRPLNGDELQAIRDLVKRRASREPLAYIRGTKEFYSLEFAVNPAVLIPRPETELLVEEGSKLILSLFPSPLEGEGAGEGGFVKILDIGTGSGCIAIALAKHLPHAEIWAVDSSPEALQVASFNAKKHEVQDRVHFVPWDMKKDPWKGPPDHFDLIVSNPPYIPSGKISELAPELQFEPRSALDGGEDGLKCYQVLIPLAQKLLKKGGSLLIEIGEGQAEALETMASHAGLKVGERNLDLAGHVRVLKIH